MTTKKGPHPEADRSGPESESTTGINETHRRSYRRARPPTTEDAVRAIPHTPLSLRAFVLEVTVSANRHLLTESGDLVAAILEETGAIIAERVVEPAVMEARMVRVLREHWMLVNARAE